MTILVAEVDDASTQQMLAGLGAAGIACSALPPGRPPSDQVNHAGVLIADPARPGLGGLELIRSLRASGVATPILLVSALCSADQRVRGLEAGADDFLCKPYAMAELVARVRALVRRRTPPGTRRIVRVGDLAWEPVRRRVERGEARLDLTPQEFTVLTLLLERQGQIVSREDLGRTLWGGSAEQPALRSPNALDALIRRLRAKVDAPFSEPLIHTCRGQGLILEARPVRNQPSSRTRA